MNCSTCRYELSQCLDGRLPSGRRAIVMRHVETCAVCGAFWAELQAAQNLTLRLASMPVSEGFRERLWERIGAGEGTPAAVFHEPVPLLTKCRYAVTGAAAAAVILLGVTWARGDRTAPRDPVAKSELHGGPATAERPGVGMQPAADFGMQVDPSPLISSARPFTCELVAVETARQLEQRHATVNAGIHRLNQDGFYPDAARSDAAVQQVLRDADEFCGLGGILLDLRDHKRLFFTDSEVDAELRLAVKMLRSSQQDVRNLETIRTLVAPALNSGRLANVSRTIALPPSDPREEWDVLMRLIATRHDVFPKLFIVFGDEAYRDFGPFPGNFFEMRDECGPVWVAPRSEVEAGDGRLRIMRARISTGQKVPGYEVQIRTARPKQPGK
ncbi:MAG TPA: hypothetical protein VFT55_00220 [Planctomycetota bacterium]|nr:hypothetical protein [Planctomycetota bacterium]